MPTFRSYIGRGSIVFTKDGSGDTRMHGRVLVVLRRNTQGSSTCFCVCKHEIADDTELHNTHRRIKIKGTQPEEEGETPSIQAEGKLALDAIEIELSRRPGFTKTLQPHIYINCEELWNLDGEVEVITLGKVAQKSIDRLFQDVRELYQDPSRRTSSGGSAETGGRDERRIFTENYRQEELRRNNGTPIRPKKNERELGKDRHQDYYR
ncbi:hypothetical protein AYO22_02537 [Fonsecaea multimorphosa]|nr:hypothetical protein AYO22_02537 [Fonsecaea multimorphosa]